MIWNDLEWCRYLTISYRYLSYLLLGVPLHDFCPRNGLWDEVQSNVASCGLFPRWISMVCAKVGIPLPWLTDFCSDSLLSDKVIDMAQRWNTRSWSCQVMFLLRSISIISSDSEKAMVASTAGLGSVGQGTPNLMKLQVCSWPLSYRAMKKDKQPHLGVEPKVHPEISSIYNMNLSLFICSWICHAHVRNQVEHSDLKCISNCTKGRHRSVAAAEMLGDHRTRFRFLAIGFTETHQPHTGSSISPWVDSCTWRSCLYKE